MYTQATGKKAEPRQTENGPSTYKDGLIHAFEDDQNTVDFYNEITDRAGNRSIKRVLEEQHLMSRIMQYGF